MALVALFLWILIWGLAGYFTVRAIMIRMEEKRRREWFAAYMHQQRTMMKHAGKTTGTQFSLNPFDDLLKKEGLA